MMEKQKVRLNTEAAKNESGNTHPVIPASEPESRNKEFILLDPRVKPEDDIFIKKSEDDKKSDVGILRKSQQSSDCCDAQSNETPRAKVAEVAAGKRMLELKNKKDTGIHKKGSPKNDSDPDVPLSRHSRAGGNPGKTIPNRANPWWRC